MKGEFDGQFIRLCEQFMHWQIYAAPVPVSGTIDKDTRRKRLLSVPRALVLFLTVVPAVILKVTVASPESCHRSTDPPSPGGSGK